MMCRRRLNRHRTFIRVGEVARVLRGLVGRTFGDLHRSMTVQRNVGELAVDWRLYTR